MLLTIQHAAAMLGVSAQTLRRWDKSGVLRARRQPGGKYRVYDERELRAWLARERVEPVAPQPVARRASLVGRDAALAELDRGFGGPGPLVVLGPAGIGKTRLVREWLATRTEPKLFAYASACTTLEELALMLGAAMGVDVRAASPTQLGADVQRALRERAGTVLVVDEIEDLDEGARALLGRVAREVGQLVVTTRVVSRLPEERIIRLEPLTDAESARVFLDRARDASGLPDEATLAAATEIARRLQGLPLALELAAARASAIGVDRVRLELRDSIDALEQPGASLRRAFESSFRRLLPRERDLLERVAFLPDAFSVDEVERVAPGELHSLQALVEHSLVRASEDGPGVVVFGVHALVRTLVIEALPADRREALGATVARAFAEEAGELATQSSTASLQRLRTLEGALLRAWHGWASRSTEPGAARAAVDIARALGRLSEVLGPIPSIVSVLERSVEIGRAGVVPAGRLADVVRFRAFTSLFQSRIDEARAGFAEALDLARAGRARDVEARIHCQVAWIALRDGDAEARGRAVDAAERVLAAHPDALAMMELATLRGQIDVLHARLPSARRHFEKARAIAVRMRDQQSETTTTGFLGVVAFEEGTFGEAVDHYDRAIATAMACGSGMFEAIYRGYRAVALHHMNDPRTEAAYEEALRVARTAHAIRYEKLFTAWYGAFLAERGEIERATRAFDEAEELTDPQAVAFFEMHRAHLDLAHADRSTEGSAERARHEARACRRFDSARLDASTPRELRVGRRFLERALLARKRASRADVVVGWRGRWVTVKRRRLALEKRAPLQRLVWELALRRVLEPGVRIAVAELFTVVWSGEKASHAAAVHRLHVALSTLRRLGLRDVIELVDDGYRFAPERTLEIVLSP